MTFSINQQIAGLDIVIDFTLLQGDYDVSISIHISDFHTSIAQSSWTLSCLCFFKSRLLAKTLQTVKAHISPVNLPTLYYRMACSFKKFPFSAFQMIEMLLEYYIEIFKCFPFHFQVWPISITIVFSSDRMVLCTGEWPLLKINSLDPIANPLQKKKPADYSLISCSMFLDACNTQCLSSIISTHYFLASRSLACVIKYADLFFFHWLDIKL